MTTRLASSLLWLGAAGCTSSAPKQDEPVQVPAETKAAAPVSLAGKAMSLWYGKPPLKSHGFDVVLQNPASEPRWLILPNTFPYEGREDPAPGGEEVELQIFRVSEAPAVVVVEGISGHFWAVRLPGGGTLALRNLRIQSWWDEVPDATTLRMIVAREVLLGERPLAEVVGQALDSASGADAPAPEGAGDKRALKFWHPPDEKAVAVRFEEESRVEVVVPLTVATQ